MRAHLSSNARGQAAGEAGGWQPALREHGPSRRKVQFNLEQEGRSLLTPAAPARRICFCRWLASIPTVVAFLLSAAIHTAAASPESARLPRSALGEIRFEQNLNRTVTLDLPFRDETGQAVRLREYFGEKPVVLVMGYSRCPMLCSMVNNGLVETLHQMKWSAGREFQILNVSIDPSELPAKAARTRRTYLKRYGRDSAEEGWHFLTGGEAAIQKLAGEIGFHYAYDPASEEYAHPSGFVVVTPEGKIARYFFGVTYLPRELYAALAAASERKVGSRVQELLILCFRYNPLQGKYAGFIMTVLRIGGAATLLGLVAALGWLLWKDRRKSPPPGRLRVSEPGKPQTTSQTP